MSKPWVTQIHFPSVRLLVAGCLSILLLLWLDQFDDTLSAVFITVRDGRYGSPLNVLMTAGISLFILITLIPVFLHGPRRDRRLAAILAVFPLCCFAMAALWVSSWLR